MTTVKTLLDLGTIKLPEITVTAPVQHEYSERQNYLYKKAMNGLKGVPYELINRLTYPDKKSIEKTTKKVQRLLNIWKQKICIEKTNCLFKELFPNTEFTQTLTEKFNNPDPGYFNTLDFKTVGITKEMIINELIKNGYLPVDYYKL
jgi:hypothetical protein